MFHSNIKFSFYAPCGGIFARAQRPVTNYRAPQSLSCGVPQSVGMLPPDQRLGFQRKSQNMVLKSIAN